MEDQHTLGMVRTTLLDIISLVGQLSHHEPIDSILIEFFDKLILLSNLFHRPLEVIIEAKMDLNEKKYPVEEVLHRKNKDEMATYTEFSNKTGIVKGNQSLDSEMFGQHYIGDKVSFRNAASEKRINKFSKDRDFDKDYNKTTLILCIVTELGELTEHVQWKDDSLLVNDMTKEKKNKIQQEVADVAIFLIRFAVHEGFDLDSLKY